MTRVTPDIRRPIVRYHGGKWKLAPWIIENLPSHRIYTESFGGAASVLLRKPRSYAEVYNDLDGEMVNLFRVVRENGSALRELLLSTPYSRQEFDLSYRRSNDSLEQARRTVVRCMMGYGSTAHNTKQRTGFRANSNRSGTTPAHDWMNYPDALTAIIERLRGVVLENREAIDVIKAHDGPETLHYVDPPYVWSERTGNPGVDKHSYRHEMNDDQHRELSEVLHNVSGMVVLSGYPSDLYEELYQGWLSIDRKAYADKARPRTERLWMNDAAWERRTEKGLFQ